MSFKSIIEDNSTGAGRAFDLFIQALIVLSLITFSVETLPNISDETRALLRTIEVITVSIFTGEYLLRVLVSDRRTGFIFSFYGLVDVAAILPFYLATGLDMRSLRAFRLLRLFRAFKLLRYSKAMNRFHRAFLIAKEELVLFSVVTAIPRKREWIAA